MLVPFYAINLVSFKTVYLQLDVEVHSSFCYLCLSWENTVSDEWTETVALRGPQVFQKVHSASWSVCVVSTESTPCRLVVLLLAIESRGSINLSPIRCGIAAAAAARGPPPNLRNRQRELSKGTARDEFPQKIEGYTPKGCKPSTHLLFMFQLSFF